jgi:hypothetical protein
LHPEVVAEQEQEAVENHHQELAAGCHQQESDPFLDIAQIEMTDPWHRCNQELIHQG